MKTVVVAIPSVFGITSANPPVLGARRHGHGHDVVGLLRFERLVAGLVARCGGRSGKNPAGGAIDPKVVPGSLPADAPQNPAMISLSG